MTGDAAGATFLAVRAITALRSRLDPVTVDRIVAVVLTVAAQLEVWLGSDLTDGRRTAAALVSLLVTSAVAVRRRWPLAVGVIVSWAVSLQLAFWGDPQIIAASVAY